MALSLPNLLPSYGFYLTPSSMAESPLHGWPFYYSPSWLLPTVSALTEDHPFPLSTRLNLNPDLGFPTDTLYVAPPTMSCICQFPILFTPSWLPPLASKSDSVTQGNCFPASCAGVVQNLVVSWVTIHSESHVHTLCPQVVAQLWASISLPLLWKLS